MNAKPHTSQRRIRRALLCLFLCCATTAHARGAGDHGHRGGFHAQYDARGSRQMERMQRQPGPRYQQQREMPPIDRQPQRPVAPQGAPEGQGRPPVFAPVEPPPAAPPSQPGRLSPDERRALRQQINEAGRDLYRPGRP